MLPTHCELKVGVCGNPTDCRDCRHMPTHVEWVCSRCLLPEDRASTFYHSGTCDRCGRGSPITIALELGTPGPGARR